MFEQHFELVSKGNPASGKIALIPWDIETFGFPVADFQIDYTPRIERQSGQIRRHLETWAKSHKIELIGAAVSAEDISKLSFIQSLGFCYIDTTLSVHYLHVQNSEYPQSEIEVFPAVKEQLQTVVEISGRSFKFGRYHCDSLFPKQLADKRYQDWVRRTFDGNNPQRLMVAEMDGRVCAFSVIQIDGPEGHLLLNAVDPDWQGKKIGLGLVASTLRYFQGQGADSVHSKVSVSNARALNLHSKLGARFVNPQILLHWHAPWAQHLLIGNKNERD